MQAVVQVFIVDTRASKRQVKDSVHRLYDIQTKKINTLIRYISKSGSHNYAYHLRMSVMAGGMQQHD